MANHRQRRANSGFSPGERRRGDRPPKQLPKLRYRVRTRTGNDRPQTVWVTGDAAYAHWLADYLCRRVGPHEAWVERAERRGDQVAWERAVRSPANLAEPKERLSLSSGRLVTARLLERRTKRGGWLAEAWENGKPVVGPVTNSESVPPTLRAKQLVTIRVAAISSDRTRVQFSWCDESGPLPGGG